MNSAPHCGMRRTNGQKILDTHDDIEKRLNEENLAALAMSEEDVLICLDAALTDEAKVRLKDDRWVK